MNSSESAEQIVKFTLEGVEVAMRIAGQNVERLAVLIYTMSKDKRVSKGKTTLNNLLKSGGSVKIFSLKENELKKFNQEAKKYGILYTALIDKKHPENDGLVDIMVRGEDASKVNHIVDRFKLSTVDLATIKSEVEKDKIEELLKEANEKGIEVKSYEERLADDILSKPIKKDENQMENPALSKTEKKTPSENLSETKNDSKENFEGERKSVRKELNKIKEEIKNNSKHHQKQVSHNKSKKHRRQKKER